MHDHSIGGSIHDTLAYLLFDLSSFRRFFHQLAFCCRKTRLSGFDITVKLHEHLLFRKVLQHVQFAFGNIEFVLGIGNCELICLKCQFIQHAFGYQTQAASAFQLCLSQFLLGSRFLGENLFLICLVNTFKVFLSRNLRLLQLCLGSCQTRFCGDDLNLLLLQIQFQFRRIQFHQLIALFNFRAFFDYPQDRSTTTTAGLDLANDLGVAAAFNLPLLQHDVIERSPASNLCDQFVRIHCPLGAAQNGVASTADDCD